MDKGKTFERLVMSILGEISWATYWLESRRDWATRSVILTNFGSISRNLVDISECQGLQSNSKRLTFCGMDKGKIFEPFFMSSLAEI